MSSYVTAVAWVVARLAANPAVAAGVGDRIFEGSAPVQAAYPLVLIQPYTDPVDTNYLNGRALTAVDLVVRVWDSAPESRGSSYARIVPIERAVDAALSNQPPALTELGYVAGCVRVAEMPSIDASRTSTGSMNAAVNRALGGRYTVTVSPLA